MHRILALALVAAACSEGPAPSAGAAREASPVPLAAAEPKVELQDPSGRTLLKVKSRADGFRFVDGADTVLGEAKVQADRVKLKDASDVERWKIKRKDYGAEIEDAAGTRLFRARRGDAGEWKLVDAADAVVARCKPKENGFEVRDPQGKTLAKVKVRTGKLAFETEGGERLFDLDGTTSARAGMWFAVDRLSLIERAALFAYFRQVEP